MDARTIAAILREVDARPAQVRSITITAKDGSSISMTLAPPPAEAVKGDAKPGQAKPRSAIASLYSDSTYIPATDGR
jgi:hypothetical protein